MTETTQADKINVISKDIYDGMTQKEVDAFVLWQITASLEQLPEEDVNGMYGEILAENATCNR
jgi:O-glycosyl hydrolase